MRIMPIGTQPASGLSAVTRTAAVGPRLQPEKKAEAPELDAKELRTRRDTIQNQLTTLKGVAEGPDGNTVKALESKLGEVNDQLSAAEAQEPAKPSALERLKGQTDLYETAEETQGSDKKPTSLYDAGNDDAPEKEVKKLDKKQHEISKEMDAVGKRGDSDAWDRLMKQLKSVQAEMQQKTDDSKKGKKTSVVPGVNM